MESQSLSRDEKDWSSWLKKACAGDDVAYRCFLQSVSVVIRGVIKAKAGGLPVEQQEDILQDVLFAIHQKRSTWRQDLPVKPWVYAIARYKIVDAFRARGKADFVDIDDFSEVLPAQTEDVTHGMDIETMVADLPPKQQKVVRLIAIDGMSIKDAAQHLGITQTAVRVNFHRGLERLRVIAKEDEE